MLEVCQGICVNDVKITGLFYADDIIFMACSKDDILYMLIVTDNFSCKWGVSFIETKSQGSMQMKSGILEISSYWKQTLTNT